MSRPLFGITTQYIQWDGVLQYLAVRGWEIVRLNYQSSVEEAVNAIRQADAAHLKSYLILKDPDWITRLRDFVTPDQLWGVSGPNEPDLENTGYMDPSQYRIWIDRAAPQAEATGLSLYAPVISNLNDRGLKYLKAVWPTLAKYPWVGVDIHRYAQGNGIEGGNWAKGPAENNRSRADEIPKLKRIIGDRHWLCSETGYHTAIISEHQQAMEITREFEYAQTTDARAWFYYQLNRNDSTAAGPLDQYGLLRTDGRWLEGANALLFLSHIDPETPTEEPIMNASIVISRKDLIPHTEKAGVYVVRYPDKDGKEAVLSVQPDGSIETRVKGTEGAYEQCIIDGTALVFPDVAGHHYAFRLVA